ncbi:MAG: tyrosine-type recombinase/integrase [Candidatus Yanofskybacteria bacterium]|nr:tyrosine-type recombinase/integrase [Candidatus Yanofskybacteria bacterium]
MIICVADVKQLKNDFLEYLEIEKNRSSKTVENYGHYLNRFLNFAKVGSASQISEDLIRKFRIYLNRLTDNHGESLKKVTQNYHIIAIRAFLKYLSKREIKSVSPEKIELGKQEDRHIDFLESNELARLLASPKDDNLSDLRDKAILETLFSTGLRVSELCSLETDKVDLNRGEISVKGKGSKIRLVFLSDDAQKSISSFLKKRSDADPALFIRIPKDQAFGKYENLRLSPRSIQRIIKKHATRAGIVGKKVSPHSLRHSMATDLLRNGADIRSVQAILGHSSVTTTQIYTHVTDSGLKEIHKKFHKKRQG